jgi:signal transduction histidine kinase
VKERFFKGKNAKAGSGIGLAISDEIIRMHGGELFIESKRGKFTKVTILLPCAPEEK